MDVVTAPDLDLVVARMGGWATPRWWTWALDFPGTAALAWGADGALLAGRDLAVNGASSRVVWRTIARRGAATGARRSLAALEPSTSIIEVGPGLGRPTSTWLTGPDPFEPLAPRVERFTAAYASFAARSAPPGWSLARGPAWWTWRVAEPDGAEIVPMAVATDEAVTGLVVARVVGSGVRRVEVLELRAVQADVHYALLKAVRRLSWERGGLPVVLRGADMSKRYAFTAGFIKVGGGRLGAGLSAWAGAGLAAHVAPLGRTGTSEADWTVYAGDAAALGGDNGPDHA